MLTSKKLLSKLASSSKAKDSSTSSRHPSLEVPDLSQFLLKYGYEAVDDKFWKRKTGNIVELKIAGHGEVDGHTRYTVECKLSSRSSGILEWTSCHRLAQLRSELHDPLKERLGPLYDYYFQSAPFAHKGGPVGTTSRLDQWCKALAACVNSDDTYPSAVGLVLKFFDAPDPGQFRPQTEKQGAQSAKGKSSTPSCLSAEQLEENRWRLFGLHTDSVLKLGLRHINAALQTEDLLALDHLELRGGNIMESLLTGENDLKGLLPEDVSEACGDLKKLSLPQLLSIRIRLLTYVPRPAQPGANSHAEFMATLDALVFQTFAADAIRGTSLARTSPDGNALQCLGVQLMTLVSAARAPLDGLQSVPKWWVWWVGPHIVYFNVESFSCSDAFPSHSGVMQLDEKPNLDPSDSGPRRKFDWNVLHVKKESEVRKPRQTAQPNRSADSARQCEPATRKAGYNVTQSQAELEKAAKARDRGHRESVSAECMAQATIEKEHILTTADS